MCCNSLTLSLSCPSIDLSIYPGHETPAESSTTRSANKSSKRNIALHSFQTHSECDSDFHQEKTKSQSGRGKTDNPCASIRRRRRWQAVAVISCIDWREHWGLCVTKLHFYKFLRTLNDIFYVQSVSQSVSRSSHPLPPVDLDIDTWVTFPFQLFSGQTYAKSNQNRTSRATSISLWQSSYLTISHRIY